MPSPSLDGSAHSLGEQELELLRFLGAQNRPVSVGEAAESYGTERNLSRSTVVTMMERLRKKGYLVRAPGTDGVLLYTPQAPPEQTVQGLVGRFVERTLGGSLTPLAAYFAGKQKLSPDEVKQLNALLEKLQDTPDENDDKGGPQ